MITPSSGSVSFLTNFSVILTLDTGTTATSITADFVDPGVTTALGTSTITISGVYNAIIPITWTWIDNNRTTQTGKTAPAVGTYEKISSVASPSFLSKVCTYTINGTFTFAHTVSLGSYDVIKNQLTTALAGAR
jgi:hypothetical protein